MSVHRTPSGLWYCKYYMAGRSKKRYFGRGNEGKLAAQEWDVRLKKDRAAQGSQFVPVTQADYTFLDIAQKYLDARPLTPKHRESMVLFLNGHVAATFGEKLIAQLSMADLETLDARLRKLGRSMATRNRYGSYCKAILAWGEYHELIPANPFRRFRPEKRRETKADPPPTEAELAAIWDHAPDHLRVVIWAMLHLGLRPGPTELYAVRIADIDWDRCGVWVERRKTHSPRTLQPVLPSFLEGVRAILADHPARQYLIEYHGQPVIKLKKAWGAAKAKAGITRRMPIYSLRHFYATSLLRAGADLKAVSELMGHASVRQTAETYYHLVDAQKRAALAVLPTSDGGTILGLSPVPARRVSHN